MNAATHIKPVTLPDIGDFDQVEIIELHVAEGDTVEKDQALVTLETDKAAMDVPAPFAGIVQRLAVSQGSKISTGDHLLDIEVTGTEEAPVASDKSTAEPAEPIEQSVTLPNLGDFDEVEIIELHVKVGDELNEGDAIITLETDKAAMDVPATLSGKITEVHVKVGAKVAEGDRLLTVLALPKAGAAPAEPAAAPSASSQPVVQAAPQQPQFTTAVAQLPVSPGGGTVYAGPAVRFLARELGVDLRQVKGSGFKGRIQKADVKAFVRTQGSGGVAWPEVPKVDFAKYGKIETQALTRVQKIAGPRLAASWVNLPHVTQHDEIDMTDLEVLRNKYKGQAKAEGFGLTPLAFLMRACVASLQEFPIFNSSLNEAGDALILKQYYHLGFAADTDQGLMVPVIKDVDGLSVMEIAKALGDLSAAARDGQLAGTDMQGGTFTISSLGGIGGTAFTPIVNAPEVAILGVSKAYHKPVYQDGEFVPRLMLPISLSYDHRVIDGAAAVRFTRHLDDVMNDLSYFNLD